MYRVLDLSNNNDVSSWGAIKRAGITGVWLKVTEGATFTDPDWLAYSRHARHVGLRVGGYHFAYPTGGDAVQEARYFASKLGKVGRRDLRPVLDFETNAEHMSGKALTAWARAFSKTCWNLTGTLPIFYSYPYFIQALEARAPIGAGLWLAAYGPNDGRPHPFSVPRPWRKAVAHQFTSNAHIPGVNGRCDVSEVPKLRPILAHPRIGL